MRLAAAADAVSPFVRAHAEPILELLARMVAVDSVTGNESELARLCASWFAEHGIEARLEPCKGRFNVCGISGAGADALVFSGHLDTVPQNSGAWTYGPFVPARTGGRLFGLGASDLKASLAAACFAQLFLKDVALGGRIVNAFTVEEETTGDGTRAFLDGALASGLLDPERTAALVMEPTGLDHVSLGNRGTCFQRVVITGRGGHGSRPGLARNPIDVAAAVIAGLDTLVDGWNRRFPDADFGGSSVTPTHVVAGRDDGHNVIPAEAAIVLDCRSTPALYADDFAVLHDELDAYLSRFARDGFALRREEFFARPGHRLPADHPLARIALTVLQEDLGREHAVACFTPAGNDAVFFGLAGIPALNKCGPGHPEWAHRADESVAEENVLLGAEFLIHTALRWFALRSLPRDPAGA